MPTSSLDVVPKFVSLSDPAARGAYVVYFDAKIPDRAFDFGMAKQKLDTLNCRYEGRSTWPLFAGANASQKA